jgi:hypothetical protein
MKAGTLGIFVLFILLSGCTQESLEKTAPQINPPLPVVEITPTNGQKVTDPVPESFNSTGISNTLAPSPENCTKQQSITWPANLEPDESREKALETCQRGSTYSNQCIQRAASNFRDESVCDLLIDPCDAWICRQSVHVVKTVDAGNEDGCAVYESSFAQDSCRNRIETINSN